MDVGRQRDVGPDTVPVICEEQNGLDIVPATPLRDCVNIIVIVLGPCGRVTVSSLFPAAPGAKAASGAQTTNDAVCIPKIPSRCISSPRAS
jgi:hypothetical protein